MSKSGKKFKVVVRTDFCKGCYLCMEYCPKNVFRISEKSNIQGYHAVEPVKQEDCTGCMSCTLVCPDVAIEVYDE